MTRRRPLNAPGDFYVDDTRCLTCSCETFAPDVMSADDKGVCFVARQPETPEEVDQMIAVMAQQMVDAIRYGGTDAGTIAALAAVGEAYNCDHHAAVTEFRDKGQSPFRWRWWKR